MPELRAIVSTRRRTRRAALHSPAFVAGVVEEAVFSCVALKNILILRHGGRRFGKRRGIHLWLSWHDADNATLMVLLAYLVLGHSDWRKATIHIYAALPHGQVEEQKARLLRLIAEGRVPISPHNVSFLPSDDGDAFPRLVEQFSADADLVLMGMTPERLREHGGELLMRHPSLGDVLFVYAMEKVLIE
jgi:hypothetical protein